MKPPTTIVLASRNRGKIREMSRLLSGLPLDILSLADFPGVADVEESGSAFRENAEIKAREFAKQTSQLCLADDSGLEIEALDGEPGVLSARFAGPETGYDVKNALLLEMVEKSGDHRRRARFVCAMALADAAGNVVQTVEGVCDGSISDAPLGTNGFGYDPIFIPDGYDKTFGELGDDVKQLISHRGRAADEIVRYLLDFIAK